MENVLEQLNASDVEGTSRLQKKMANLSEKECRDYLFTCMEAGVDPSKDPGVEIILLRALLSTRFFALVFMAEAFKREMTYQQDEIWELLDDSEVPKVGICAWRGCGKTTMSAAKLVKELCFRLQQFIVYVSKTYTHSVNVMESVKREILSNRLIRYVFGSLKTKKADDVDIQFSKDSWFLCDPTSKQPFAYVVPRGCRQQVHGMNVRLNEGGNYLRPTLIFCDDLEDPKEVYNGDLRKETWQWLNESLFETVDDMSHPDPTTNRWDLSNSDTPPWRIIFIDTLKHQDSCMAKILKSGAWVCRRLPQSEYREVIGDDGEPYLEAFSCVPSIISDEQVRAQIKQAEEDMHIESYARNRMCLAVSPKHASFQRTMFKYFSDDPRKFNQKDYYTFIVVDPARSMEPTSADTAILAVSISRKEGHMYFRACLSTKLHPADQAKTAVDLALLVGAQNICVEDIGLVEYARYIWISEIESRGLMNLNLVWLKRASRPPGDFGEGKEAVKRAWASTLIYPYKKGLIFHENHLKHGPLEQTLLDYPKCSKWDVTDVAAHALVHISEQGYYQPQSVNPNDLKEPAHEMLKSYSSLGTRIKQGSWRLS